MKDKRDILNLAAVLLAAGPSTRLGYPKQMVNYRGETLVRRAARLLRESVSGAVVVVTGHGAEQVSGAVEDIAVETVINHEWDKGMGGSIARGVGAVPAFADGILVSVCDQWQLSRGDLGKLVESWSAEPQRIHMACWKEGAAHVSGPPVIFPGRLRGDLKGLEKSRGARQIIDRYMDVVEFVKLESAADDLDRPEDLEKLLGAP